MTSLARDAAAFKSALHRQEYPTWHSHPPKPGGSSTNTNSTATTPASDTQPNTNGTSSGPPKKKKARTNVVFSQPADTGTGNNINTQLVYAVDHLKSTHNPMRLQDIAIVTSTPLDTDRTLLDKFKAHDRIQYDPKTDLYSYRHDFNFRSKAALLVEIQRHTQKGSGISVRTLRESWKDAPNAIEELEKEGEVLCTRTTKDGQLRMVFWNEVKPGEGDSGGSMVDKEFVDLWHNLKVPNDVDLLRSLAAEGLKETVSAASPVKPTGGKKKGKRNQARSRQFKLTNTHLKGTVDLSKDYVAQK